jgi:hypothetical protein
MLSSICAVLLYMLDAELLLQPELGNFSAAARTSLRIWQPSTIKTRVWLTLSLCHTNNGKISRLTISQAGPSARAVEGVGLRPLSCWDCGLEPHRKHGCLVCCECCVLSGRDLYNGLITRPEKSYRLRCVVVYDLETSWMRRPWLTDGLQRQIKKKRKSFRRGNIKLYRLAAPVYPHYCIRNSEQVMTCFPNIIIIIIIIITIITTTTTIIIITYCYLLHVSAFSGQSSGRIQILYMYESLCVLSLETSAHACIQHSSKINISNMNIN